MTLAAHKSMLNISPEAALLLRRNEERSKLSDAVAAPVAWAGHHDHHPQAWERLNARELAGRAAAVPRTIWHVYQTAGKPINDAARTSESLVCSVSTMWPQGLCGREVTAGHKMRRWVQVLLTIEGWQVAGAKG